MFAKILKAALFIVPTIFMFLTMTFAPDLADVTSPFYVVLVGTFLGFDLAAVIKKTKSLDGTEFSKIKAWRYVIVGLSITVLLARAFIGYKTHNIMTLTVASLSASIYILASIVIAGLDLNRAATATKGGAA